uniref:Uncharacterized protein n=1 Tax=Rhizophora mucronata TaxID=61149 RepID=A0A2P2PQQ1_RHIMU
MYTRRLMHLKCPRPKNKKRLTHVRKY